MYPVVANPVTVDGVGYVSNRQLISDYVQGNGGPFIVNDIHQKQAEGIVQYLEQTVLMQSLRAGSGAPDRFLGQLSALLADKDISKDEELFIDYRLEERPNRKEYPFWI